MNTRMKTALALAALAVAAQASAQITFYEHNDFAGRTFTTERSLESFQRSGFNDSASSVVVLGSAWEVCENSAYGGRCAKASTDLWQPWA